MSNGGTKQSGTRSPFGSGYVQPRADSGNSNLLDSMRNFTQAPMGNAYAYGHQTQPSAPPNMMYPGGSPGFYSGAQGATPQIQPIKQAYSPPVPLPSQPPPDMMYAGGSPNFNMFGGQFPTQVQAQAQVPPQVSDPRSMYEQQMGIFPNKQPAFGGGIASLLPYRQV